MPFDLPGQIKKFGESLRWDREYQFEFSVGTSKHHPWWKLIGSRRQLRRRMQTAFAKLNAETTVVEAHQLVEGRQWSIACVHATLFVLQSNSQGFLMALERYHRMKNRIMKLFLIKMAFFTLSIHGAPAGESSGVGADDSSSNSTPTFSVSILPIAMYDSDIGFGFGARAVAKNLRTRKSYDWILFGSTLGEQWYAFSYSAPDRGLRHGLIYRLAYDLTIEYDKLLKSNFFGIGNKTADNDNRFPRESFRLKLSASHAFSNKFSATAKIGATHYSVYDYDVNWPIDLASVSGAGESQLLTVGVSNTYDTRDNILNPGHGIRIETSLERAIKAVGFDWDFGRTRLELSGYKTLWRKGNVLAGRLWLQDMTSGAPFQELSKIGDGWTARGYKAGRFLDRAMVLTSLEHRFPIYSKLGGVIFVDSGRVWHGLKNSSLRNWHFNWGMGLRYYLANFVGRLDVGKSNEGTRIFFNFGHVF